MELINGKYKYEGGVDPLAVGDEFGYPVYVYESAIMKRQLDRLRNAFSVPKLKINYACKALSNPAVLKLFRAWGTGLDTVSINEVKLGLLAGFEPENIIFTPSCISFEEIEAVIKMGVKITVDSIILLEQLGQKYPDLPLCIRVNPHIMAGGNHKISVGHVDSKFGISFHQMPHVYRLVESLGIRIEGIHMHTGSDIYDADVFLKGAEILFDIASHFPSVDFIDFGSGFKVAYKTGDICTDIESLGQQLSVRFKEFIKSYGRELTLMFEPGKYLVSEAGTFLVAVNVVKQTTASTFAGVNSGLNHLIRPMLYDAYHDILNISNPETKKRIYNIVGYICETDTFGINRRMDEIREGDILAFRNAGAYCYTMSSNYNSRLRPAEVLIHEGKPYLIRRRETFDNLMENVVEMDV